jgi:sec-independent protein translocase protein TatA
MFANIFGTDGIIVLIVALVVLFGGSQLPKLAKNLGSAGREFRKAQQEAEEESAAQASKQAAPNPTAIGPAPTAAPATPPTTPAEDDKLVISRSELRQELSNIMDQRQQQGGQ